MKKVFLVFLIMPATGFATSPEVYSLTVSKDSKTQFCQDLRSLPRTGYSFDFLESATDFNSNKDICRGIWNTDIPFWKALPQFKGDLPNTSAYKLPSRSQILKSGARIALPSEQADFVHHVEELRAKAAQSCCDNDESCFKSMLKVQVLSCDSTQGEKNPDIPDECARPGFYTFIKASESDQFRYNLDRALVENPKIDEQYKIAAKEDLEGIVSANPKRVREAILGDITLSSIRRNNEPIIGDFALVHEFGHACSMIRRQNMAFRERDDAAAINLWHTTRDSGYHCYSFPAYESVYGKILKNTFSAKSVSACLWNIAEQFSQEKSSVPYVQGSCGSGALEEAFAQAFPVLTGLFDPKRDFSYLCYSGASGIHPPSSEILECVLQNSMSARTKFLSGMCNASD